MGQLVSSALKAFIQAYESEIKLRFALRRTVVEIKATSCLVRVFATRGLDGVSPAILQTLSAFSDAAHSLTTEIPMLVQP